jgi:signal transduction histidine kinase/CheY-like chemotaxis protein/Flp pilus assembly protein TadD
VKKVIINTKVPFANQFLRFCMLCCVFVLIFISNINASELNIDSLQLTIKNAETEEQRLEGMVLLSWHHAAKGLPNSADFIQQTLDLAEKHNNEEFKARAKVAKIFVVFENQDYYVTTKELEENIPILIKYNREQELARSYVLLGIAQERQGRFNEAIKSYFNALFIFDKLNDLDGIADCYNNIGLIYKEQKRFYLAEVYFNKSLDLAAKIATTNEDARINAINNLAILYQETGKVSKALPYFLEVYEYDKKSNSTENLGLSYNNLGVIYTLLKDYKKALDFLRKATEIKKNSESLDDLSNSYNNLGFCFYGMKLYDSAEFYYKKGEFLAKRGSYLSFLQESYIGLADVYAAKGEFPLALKYEKLNNGLKDTLYRANGPNSIDKLKGDYITLKQEKDESEVLIQTERTRIRRIFIWFVLALFSVLMILMWFYVVKVKKNNTQLNQKQKKIEIQNKILQVKNIEILQAKEAAEEAAKVKSQFISTISHEIRTPLNAIIGATNLLNQNFPNQDQIENLNILKISSDNLLSLVNNILDFSKMEAGKMQFENIEFNLKNIVLDIRDLFSIKAAEKGVELLVNYDEKIPAVLKGDPLRINQLLINLVSNALKFTEKGYVKVDLSMQLSTVNHALIHVKVSDTGIGISSQKQTQIFESFTQADGTITRKFGGSGLGLSICKRILENLNSKLQLSSEPGVGSTFYFSINFEVSRNAAIGKSSRTASFENSIKGKRILIAEDNMMNILVIRQFLHKWGVVTDVVMNGKEAYAKVSAETFDAVLMDIHMPEMDGIEATRLIRKLSDERKRRIPIIAITAENEMQFRQKVYEVGMNDYIFKPFNPDDLRERLGYVLYNNHLFVSSEQEKPFDN